MSDTYERGMKVRRAVLGDAHVDRATAGATDFTREFQDLITRYAWGEIWTRPGLDRKTRSCMVLTAMIALGHWDEFRLHVRAAFNNGLTRGRDQGGHPAGGDLLRRAGRQPRLQGGGGGHRGARGRPATHMSASGEAWPEAPVEGWLETCATLQMWTQIVGKVRLARAPMLNHWWHVDALCHARAGSRPRRSRTAAAPFQIDFDFIDHRLVIATSDGRREEMPLALAAACRISTPSSSRGSAALGIDVAIWPVPVEVADAVPFTEDHGHSEYEPEIAERLWRILSIADMALTRFRGGFLGKAQPGAFLLGQLRPGA